MEEIKSLESVPNSFASYDEFASYKIRCRACPIGNVYDKVVLSCGQKNNPKVVVCGEAPGKDEVEQGFPFVGKSGKLLRDKLNANGFSQGNTLITNIIPCRPENNKFPQDDSMIHECKNIWLKKELKLLNPDFLLLVGGKPLKFLLGIQGITHARGHWYSRKLNGKTVRIMPTFHPSYILRIQFSPSKKHLAESFANDIRMVGEEAGFC